MGKSPSVAELLSFADSKDVEDFVFALERFERGEWSPEQFRSFRLLRGTYGQRQDDVVMLRVKIPQGTLSAEQLERLADVADTYSTGAGHVTTRQNIQLYSIKLRAVPAAQRALAEVGITTREACGNTVRNVTACPMAGVCRDEAFDVTPYGQAISRHFLRHPESQALPRKFKIALSGCASDCAMGAINDVGLIAQAKDGRRGFTVKVGGGLSVSPENAHLLYDFLDEDEVLAAIDAVIAVFNKHGNRQNKARARLKYVLRKLGFAGFQEEFAKELGAIRDIRRPIDLAPGELLTRAPSLPFVKDTGVTAPEVFQKTNVTRQKQNSFSAVTVRLLRGDITSTQLRGVAQLARRFGDGMVRLTIDQNLLMRFVADGNLAGLHRELASLGLAESNARTIADITSCPGSETCKLAVTASRELASELATRLASEASTAIPLASGVGIKISGCPHSCGQHHIAGIGLHGGMRRIAGRIAPEYTLHLGGGVDGSGATFGRQLVRVPARRVSDAVLRLLRLFQERRAPSESALEFLRRLGKDDVEAALGELLTIDETTATPADFLDVGDAADFEVKTGPGECAS